MGLGREMMGADELEQNRYGNAIMKSIILYAGGGGINKVSV